MNASDTASHRAHQPRLVQSAHGHRIVHGTGAIGRLNTTLALAVTRGIGTMWVAYLFAGLALISLPAALRTGDVIVIVGWVAQTFLQLVLLPIIIVGQNVSQATSDARAEADHETLAAIHRLTVAVLEIDERQTRILERLERGR